MSMSSLLFSEKVTEIEESFRRARLFMDQNRFYLVNDDTYVISVYSRKDYSRLFQFGKKGEGPGEFKFVGSLSSSSKNICVCCPGKISYFSMSGKFLQEQKISSRMWVDRVGTSFVGRKTIRSKDRRSSTTQYVVFDSKVNPIKVIFEIKSAPMIFVRGGKKHDRNLVSSWPGYRTSKDKIVLGDPRKGMCFTIYDESGEKVHEFTHEYKKEKVTKEFKDLRIKRLKERQSSSDWEQFTKMFNLTFSEYFPPYRYFFVADEKIFAILYQTENDRRRLLVFDFKGNLIKKGSIISGHSGVICDNHFYYLKENEDSEMWELHREKLL